MARARGTSGFHFMLRWTLFSLAWSAALIIIAVLSSQPTQTRRYSYSTRSPDDWEMSDNSGLIANSSKCQNAIDEIAWHNANRLLSNLKRIASQIREGVMNSKSEKAHMNRRLKLVQEIQRDLAALSDLWTRQKRRQQNAIDKQVEDDDYNYPAAYPSKPKVCPEMFEGTLNGYPLYNDGGFRTVACDDASPLPSLVSILFSPDVHEKCGHSAVENIVLKTSQLLPGVPILVSSSTGPNDVSRSWSEMLMNVTTPFALLMMDSCIFDEQINLERMIRELDRQEADFVGGSLRQPDGRWHANCYQITYQNYSLAFYPGYRKSLHECLQCDMFMGPILGRTHKLRKINFESKFAESHLRSTDFFIKSKYLTTSSSLVCPDIMFNVNELDDDRADSFVPLARKYNAYVIHHWSGRVMSFNSSQIRKPCAKNKGFALSPVCLQELTDHVWRIMEACELSLSRCQLQEGTLLGAVKLGTILPWERDADIAVLSAHFNRLIEYLGNMSTPIGSLRVHSLPECCTANRTKGGVAIINTRSWDIEINGQHQLWEDQVPTRVNLGGRWVSVSHNPARHARNRYGHEIFRHAQHWLMLGKRNGWLEYSPGSFTTCPRPGHHACLDQFQADGNLQFRHLCPP